MKPWAYLAILLAVIAAFGGTYAKGKTTGYDQRDQEVQQDIIDAQMQAAEDAEARWSASVVAASEAIKTEQVIVEKIREVEIEIPTVVEKIVTLTPECADLGPAYSGLLNDQVRAGNGVQIAATTDTADDGLQAPN